MTAVDAMALVAGVAVAFANLPGILPPFATPPPSVMLALSMSLLAWVAAMGVAAVAMGRVVRHGRGLRPAEWLAILACLAGFLVSTPIDRAIRALPWGWVEWDTPMPVARWRMAGALAVVVAVGLGLVGVARSILPAWLRSTALGGLAFLTLAGPVRVIQLEGPQLLAPAGGFGPGNGPWILWLALQWLAAAPMGLIFGIPAAAALRDRVGWRWVDWAGVLTSTLVALPIACLAFGDAGSSSGWWAERGVALGWLVGVWLASNLAVSRLGPARSRWFGDQPGGSSAIDASPAKTF